MPARPRLFAALWTRSWMRRGPDKSDALDAIAQPAPFQEPTPTVTINGLVQNAVDELCKNGTSLSEEEALRDLRSAIDEALDNGGVDKPQEHSLALAPEPPRGSGGPAILTFLTRIRRRTLRVRRIR